ncbi:MAG: chloride channel protein [Opitutales bacterium]
MSESTAQPESSCPDAAGPPPPAKATGPPFRLRQWRHLPDWLRFNLNDSQRFFLLCILCGILCGLAAVSFHLSITELFYLVEHWSEAVGGYDWAVLIGAPALGGLIVGLLLQYVAPSAAGSGIPQTKSAYYNNFGIIPLRQGIFRWLLTSLYVGLGNSLGREGPTVHLCASIASTIGQVFGLAKARVQAMVPVGFGAGIAAAFNAPLSGITFVFEELLGDFSSKALGGIIVAVVIAAALERVILGGQSVFIIPVEPHSTDWWMLVCVPLGLASALVGNAFVGILLRARATARLWRAPMWIKTTAGGLSFGILAYAALRLTGDNGLFSMGHHTMEEALSGELKRWWVLVILLVGKLAATVICYASGGSGGLFSPTLFLGAMLGSLFGLGLSELFGAGVDVMAACALLGMGSMFAATIRCPFTSFLIIFELTQNYSLMLPLMLGNGIAYLLSLKLRAVPIYDALLLQDKVTLRKMPHYHGTQDYRNLPVSTIMHHEVVSVKGQRTATENLAAIDTAHRHHDYPVVDGEGLLLGVVSQQALADLSRNAVEAAKPVQSILEARRLVTLTPETSIREAARRMVIADVELAPIVSTKDTKRLLGLVTLHDIARQQNAITEQLGR